MARSVNDRLQDETIAHGLYVSRYGTGVARRMVALLNKLDAELAAKLLVLLDGKRADTYSARRLASLLAGVRELNQQAYEPVKAALARELTRYVEYEAGYQLDLFSSIIPQQILKHVPLQSIAPEQVYAAAAAQPFQGRLLKEWGQKLEADRLDKITNAVRSGFLQGETVEQIVRRVAGTPKLNREDGVINASRRDLAVVTRTAVNHMAATARQEFAQANSDIVKAKQWSSTLDTHTSQWCIIRDRKLYTLDGKPLGHVVPYLRGPGKIHFCCRSGETLVTKSWEELKIPSGELSSATRASMDGQVPANTSYADWLARQPYARQEQVLGVTRAQMLRDGKITVPEMFNDRGEFLTLEQLSRVSSPKGEGATSFTLERAQSVAEIENGMRGVIAEELRFPEGTSLESARVAAGAAQDVITRFNLPPVSSFGEQEGIKSTAAGAYLSDRHAVHIAPWALDPATWDTIRKNSVGVDMTFLVRPEVLSSDIDKSVEALSPAELPYVAVPSVQGTVWHEMGHHLYYSNPEVGPLVESAYDKGWWRALSAYSAESPKELFAEIVSAFMNGDSQSIIDPEILEWLRTNSRT